MRNPTVLYRAKYYRPERADGAAFCSPPMTRRGDADRYLELRLREDATGGHIEECVVDVPAAGWHVSTEEE